jgi:hypothetical protein
LDRIPKQKARTVKNRTVIGLERIGKIQDDPTYAGWMRGKSK